MFDKGLPADRMVPGEQNPPTANRTFTERDASGRLHKASRMERWQRAAGGTLPDTLTFFFRMGVGTCRANC